MTAAEAPTSLRVMTMNVLARHRGWPARRPVLAAGFAAAGPDVLTLQETVVTDTYDQVADLLGEGYHVHHQPGRSDDGVGASIASRWPFEVIHEAAFAGGDHTGWIGSLTVVRVAAPAPIGPVLLAHHKPTWQSGMEHVREHQAVASARTIDRVRRTDEHVVLTGDFDAIPDSASVRFWTGRQSLDGTGVHYEDVWAATHPDAPGHTFTPRNPLVRDEWRPRPGRRIDYIMLRCGDKGAGLDITACELALAAPVNGTWASDHFAVIADLAPRPTNAQHQDRP